LGGVLMVAAAVVAALLAADAERRSLEDVAPPLSAVAERIPTLGRPSHRPAVTGL